MFVYTVFLCMHPDCDENTSSVHHGQHQVKVFYHYQHVLE